MENKKEYLNEERFKKTNKKVKVIGWIIIIGICLIIAGILKNDYLGLAESESENDVYGAWSQIEYVESGFAGKVMIMFGIFISFVGLIVRFFIGNARKIGAYTRQQEMPLQQEYIEKMAPTAGVVAKEVGKGIKEGMKDDTSSDLREELKRELREELKEELKAELKQELKEKGE